MATTSRFDLFNARSLDLVVLDWEYRSMTVLHATVPSALADPDGAWKAASIVLAAQS